jgi:hypothetical protein
MVFFLRQISKSLLVGAVSVTQLAICLLAPWFHQHPGHDHAEVKGGTQHAHGSPLTPPPSEHEGDDDHEESILHLFTSSNASSEFLRGAPPAHSEKSASAVVLIVIDSLIAAIPNSAFSRHSCLTSPILSPPQDNYVLSAANLSPPQA